MSNAFGFTDFWRSYNRSAEDKLERKEYSAIYKDFFDFLIEELLKGKEVILPEKLGRIQVIGRKAKPRVAEDGSIRGVPPNFKKSKELGKPIAQLNEHTLGVIYSYKWHKRNVFGDFKNLYTLVMSRANKRKLATKIKQGYEYMVK